MQSPQSRQGPVKTGPEGLALAGHRRGAGGGGLGCAEPNRWR